MKLSHGIRRILEIDPSATAIEFETRQLSWGNLQTIVEAVDEHLNRSGIGPNQPVALMLRNRPEMIGAILAVLSTRRCIVSINPQQGETKLCEELAQLQVPALIAVEEDWHSSRLKEVCQETGSLGILLSSHGPRLQRSQANSYGNDHSDGSRRTPARRSGPRSRAGSGLGRADARHRPGRRLRRLQAERNRPRVGASWARGLHRSEIHQLELRSAVSVEKVDDSLSAHGVEHVASYKTHVLVPMLLSTVGI